MSDRDSKNNRDDQAGFAVVGLIVLIAVSSFAHEWWVVGIASTLLAVTLLAVMP